MKKLLFLFLLIPFASFSQCSTWIGEPVKNTLDLLENAKAFVKLDIAQTSDSSRKDAIIFADSTGLFTFRVNLDQAGPVKSIYMIGPTDKMNRFYSEYLLPAIKPCEKQSSPTWIFWNNLKLVHVKSGIKKGVEMSSIEIGKA